MRKFDTGATRNDDAGRPDFEGFLSPLVLERYAEYMNRNRRQADGALRASDNWQRGIPLPAYAKSFWRHAVEFWKLHRGYGPDLGSKSCSPRLIEDACCALLFNISGYLHEMILRRLGVEDRRPSPVGDQLGGVATAIPAVPARRKTAGARRNPARNRRR